MKLKNTTHWDDKFLRRMISWCCKQIGYSPRNIWIAEFGKKKRGSFTGTAWWRCKRIRIVIGPATSFPVEPYLYPGRKSKAFMSPKFNDQLDALVGITAHEIVHLLRKNGGERYTRHWERKCVQLFNENRSKLLAEWEFGLTDPIRTA